MRALAVDPRGTGIVYAALTQGGVYKTSNGGDNWVHAVGDMPLQTYTVAVDFLDPPDAFLEALGRTTSASSTTASSSTARR